MLTWEGELSKLYTVSLYKGTNFIIRALPLWLTATAKSLQSCPTLCNPIDSSHQAPPSLGFSRQEHCSGSPFPSPMHESEKWKWSLSVVSDSSRPHGLQPTRLVRPWGFPGKSTGAGCHFLLQCMKVKSESEVAQSRQTLMTPWTAAHQAPPSMGFSMT